jgi:anion-transporting  ArsA/GET3 family ATPase
MSEQENTNNIAWHLKQKRVIVCCGAGGVGKTTSSAALALAAAREGRRVLVVTIDPSRRLAEALGIDRNPSAPMPLAEDWLRAAGVKAPGSLEAWMLDPQLVADNVVRARLKEPGAAERLLGNRIYQNVTAMITGMQEYTAVEALHGFIEDDRYDLIVLDTPPSRNALRFLDAPSRASAFLDKRILSLFIPGGASFIRRMAARLLERVMDLVFGAETRAELQSFFALFSHVLNHLNRNQDEMRVFFSKPEIGFLLVTSPDQEALTEAFYFEAKARDELGLLVIGYVLNRSIAVTRSAPFPDPDETDDPVLKRALTKLAAMARAEYAMSDEHQRLAARLRKRAGEKGLTQVLPFLPESGSEQEALIHLSYAILGEEPPSKAT